MPYDALQTSRSQRIGRLVLLAAAGCVAGACSRTIVLGSDCPELDTACVQEGPGQDGEAEADAMQVDPSDGSADALPDVDGSVGGSGEAGAQLVPLAIDNPGFERAGGPVSGDLVLQSLLQNILSLLPIPPVVAELPGWYACWVGTVNSLTWELDPDAGVSQTMGAYVSFNMVGILGDVTPIRQELPEPMMPGVSYSFELDVLSLPDEGSSLLLEFRANMQQCGDGTVLGRSDVIPSSGWTRACVTFTPNAAFTHLQIVPVFQGNKPTVNARLRMDTLEQVRECKGAARAP